MYYLTLLSYGDEMVLKMRKCVKISHLIIMVLKIDMIEHKCLRYE